MTPAATKKRSVQTPLSCMFLCHEQGRGQTLPDPDLQIQEPFLLTVPFLEEQTGYSLWSSTPALPQLSSSTAPSPRSADTMEAVVALEQGQPIVSPVSTRDAPGGSSSLAHPACHGPGRDRSSCRAWSPRDALGAGLVALGWCHGGGVQPGSLSPHKGPGSGSRAAGGRRGESTARGCCEPCAGPSAAGAFRGCFWSTRVRGCWWCQALDPHAGLGLGPGCWGASRASEPGSGKCLCHLLQRFVHRQFPPQVKGGRFIL